MFTGPLEVELLRTDGTSFTEVTSCGRPYVVAHPAQGFRVRVRLHSPWLPGNGAAGRHYVAFCKLDGECLGHCGKMIRAERSELDPWEYTFDSQPGTGASARPFTFSSDVLQSDGGEAGPSSAALGAITVHVQEVDTEDEGPHFQSIAVRNAVVGGTKMGPATIHYQGKEYLFRNKILNSANREHQALASYVPVPPIRETTPAIFVNDVLAMAPARIAAPPATQQMMEVEEVLEVKGSRGSISILPPVPELVEVEEVNTPVSIDVISLLPPVPEIAPTLKRMRSMSCSALSELDTHDSHAKSNSKSHAETISLVDGVGLMVGRDQLCDLTGHITTWKRRRLSVIEL